MISMVEKMASEKDLRLVTVNKFTGDLEEASCPICPEPPGPKLIFRTGNGIGFWKCPICDIQFASPRFTKESLLKIYENESFADLSFYDDWTYNNWKKENLHRSYITQKLKLHTLKRFLNENDRILDVGCGPGLFCLEASKNGLNAEGIEPSRMLVDIGRNKLNIDIHYGLLEDFRPTYKFNGITIWDVLEHIPNPVEILTKSYDLMEDDGYLFVQVPNYEGISNRFKTFLNRSGIKNNDFKHFGFPWHIFSFNQKSLSILLKTCGFTPVLFESWSHKLKEGSLDLISRIIISLSKKYNLSDYITCLAQKI